MLVLQACRPCAANIHTKFKASGLEGNLFSPVKTQDLRLQKPYPVRQQLHILAKKEGAPRPSPQTIANS